MENASKALLIAAAVLIVILLIAFAMGIFNTSKNSGNADEVAGTIKDGIGSATDNLEGLINGEKTLTVDEFNAQFKVNILMTYDDARKHCVAITQGKYNTKTVDGDKTVLTSQATGLDITLGGESYIIKALKDAQGYINQIVLSTP